MMIKVYGKINLFYSNRSPSYLSKTNQKLTKILLAMPSINLSRRKFILKKLQIWYAVYQIPLIQELISGQGELYFGDQLPLKSYWAENQFYP